MKFIKNYKIFKLNNRLDESITYIGRHLEDDKNIEILKELFNDVKDFTNRFLNVSKIKNADPDLEKYLFVYEVDIHYDPFNKTKELFNKIKLLINANRLKEYGFKIAKVDTSSINVISLFIFQS
jgi:hypothetical protein